ncbi:MAG: universal stress protein [Gammaproteobacteria bacterium]|nr:universal stress protein [Gammaproteobacteria bacterium]
MTKTMLVGIDGSAPGTRAAEFAASIAGAQKANLLVVYVIPWSPFTFNTPEENESRHRRREEEIELARSKMLAPLLDSLAGAGCKVEGLVRHGRPAEIINYVAGEKGAVQIFIGRTGDSGLKDLLFGSVAGNLVQTASVPVTIIP